MCHPKAKAADRQTKMKHSRVVLAKKGNSKTVQPCKRWKKRKQAKAEMAAWVACV
jgi:hypothetical protein